MGSERGERTPLESAGLQRVARRELGRGNGTQDFARLRTSQMVDGIESGAITDPEAVPVLVRKQLEWERTVYRGNYLKEIEGRYAPLLRGKPEDLAQYCRHQADQRMSLGYETPSDATDYAAATAWYDMASRFAHQAAGSTGDTDHPDKPRASAQGEPTADRTTRAVQAHAAVENIVTGIETGRTTDPEAVRDLAAWELELHRATLRDELLREQEKRYAALLYGPAKDLVRFCLDEADPQRGGLYHNDEAVAHWYAMAARFARQAAREERAADETSERNRTKQAAS
jgi:hypothetical protein